MTGRRLHEGSPERLAGGAWWLEGPAWTPFGLLVSDIPNNRIVRWAGGPDFEVFAADAEFPNGRTVAPDGRVLQCSHGRRAVEELHADGSTTVLVDRFGDARFNSPNDLVVGPDGAIWFTDPAYGIIKPEEGHPGVREYGDHYLFRLDEAAGDLRPMVLDVDEPNGLAFSPDGSVLYVADTSANPQIRAYDVRPGRAPKNGRVFARMPDGMADGLRVDEAGRVWTSHGAGVSILDPDGTVLDTIAFPQPVANLCFGGEDGTDLFVAATSTLWRLRTSVRDHEWASRLG